MPLRAFDAGISINDMDKRIYNEKVFAYKKDQCFNDSLTKVLIIGNSFARTSQISL